MSCSVQGFFVFSAGLKKDIAFSKSAWESFEEGIARAMEALEIEDVQERFSINEAALKGIEDDENLCEFASRHNWFYKWVYRSIQEFGDKPSEDGVMLTVEYFKSILPLLREIIVPIERWTREYYIERMEAMFDIMKGRENTEGINFGVQPLTTDQAEGVVWLMSTMFDIDQHQADLSVPKGYEDLRRSDDYFWCENCGAVDHSDTCDDEEDGETKCTLCQDKTDEEE